MTTRFVDHLLTGDHASRPAFGDVPQGTLYACSDHGLVYQSDGVSAWSTWATLGGGAPAAHAASHESGGSDEIDVTGLIGAGGGGGGVVVQIVNTQTGAVATGTTVTPFDDTIPQNTEGNEFMTLAVTPTDATNILKIDVVFYGTPSTAPRNMCAALFQDSVADAIAAGYVSVVTAAYEYVVAFTHYMVAGTTSATTFKVRAGVESSGTITFNGTGSTRRYGGVMASSITITEIVP